jgi:hypothetical protein
MQLLQVPTLSGSDAVDKMVTLWDRSVHLEGADCVELDLSGCRFLDPSAIAFLAGVVDRLAAGGTRVTVDWGKVETGVCVNLGQNGFREHVSRDQSPWRGNSVPLKRVDLSAGDLTKDFVGYLRDSWLRKQWVNFSEPLISKIVGVIWEIVENAAEHAEVQSSAFCCGQYFPKKRRLELTFMDFGVGIPHHVRRHLGAPQMSGAESMRWARVRGNSTRRQGMGGLGLDLLIELVRLNQGGLVVNSGDGRLTVGRVERYASGGRFPGTLVTIAIQCDAKFYCLSSELPLGPRHL